MLSAILRKSAAVIGRLLYVREYLTIIVWHVSTAPGLRGESRATQKSPERIVSFMFADYSLGRSDLKPNTRSSAQHAAVSDG
jgi:hypothetical protein